MQDSQGPFELPASLIRRLAPREEHIHLLIVALFLTDRGMERTEEVQVSDAHQRILRAPHSCTYSLITDRPIDAVCISVVGSRTKSHFDCNSTSTPSDFSLPAYATWIIRAIVARLKSLIPRRLDEPTGPMELVCIGGCVPFAMQTHEFSSELTKGAKDFSVSVPVLEHAMLQHQHTVGIRYSHRPLYPKGCFKAQNCFNSYEGI